MGARTDERPRRCDIPAKEFVPNEYGQSLLRASPFLNGKDITAERVTFAAEVPGIIESYALDENGSGYLDPTKDHVVMAPRRYGHVRILLPEECDA